MGEIVKYEWKVDLMKSQVHWTGDYIIKCFIFINYYFRLV